MKTDTTVSCELGKTWRVERQRPQECLLATLATLSGQPYSYVRAKAHYFLRHWYAENTGSIPGECTWQDYAIGHHAPYKWAADKLTSLLDLPRISFQGTPGTPTERNWVIPLHGQGYIRFKYLENNSHIAPWRDGLIYDVAENNPMHGITLSDYLARWSCVVLAIETTHEGD